MIDHSQRKEGAILNDITAISGIKNRDERIINEVIVKYSKLLWPIASAVLKNVGSEQDVEECIADVFIYPNGKHSMMCATVPKSICWKLNM